MMDRPIVALLAAAVVGAGSAATARAQCAEQAVRDAVARQPGGLASVVRVARPRSGAGVIVEIGEVAFDEPVFGAVVRPGCTAVVAPYHYVVTRTDLTGADVFFPPQRMLGTAVLVLRAGRLVHVARTEVAANGTGDAPVRRVVLRDVDGAGALEIVESGAVAAAGLGPRPAERAWTLRGSRLLELPLPLESAREGVTLGLDGWDVQGSLPAEAVIVDLRLRLSATEPCYEELLRSDPDAVRSALVRLTISADGAVEAARITESDEPSPSFRRCVLAALQPLQLSGADGRTTIVVPLRFAPPTALTTGAQPPVAFRITGLSGALRRETVAERLSLGAPGVRRCYAERANEEPAVRHVLTAHLRVGDLGGVLEAALTGNARPPHELGACIEGVLRAVRFPRRPAGGTRVQLELTPSAPAP